MNPKLNSDQLTLLLLQKNKLNPVVVLKLIKSGTVTSLVEFVAKCFQTNLTLIHAKTQKMQSRELHQLSEYEQVQKLDLYLFNCFYQQKRAEKAKKKELSRVDNEGDGSQRGLNASEVSAHFSKGRSFAA